MSNTFQTISPIDGSVTVEKNYASKVEIQQALTSSKTAQKAWSMVPLSERILLARNFVEQMLAQKHEYGTLLAHQMGRPISYGYKEIETLAERANYMIEIAEESLENIVIKTQGNHQRQIKRFPLGTVFVIAPWNYPYITAVNTIIPAILAGNSILLKHASQTPLVAEHFAACFKAAGLSESIFQYLHLTHSDTLDIISQGEVNFVAFTGSVQAGMTVHQAAAQSLTPVGLELGGKDPAYVRQDANLRHTVGNLVDGAFFNSGQSCCGIERIYVHQSLYSDFVEQYVELTKTYRVGNPLDSSTTLGPVAKVSAANTIRQSIEVAKQQGAKLLLDPKQFKYPDFETYLPPQVLTQVNHEMSIMREESFGPVVGIMEVVSDKQALSLMNDSQYGLTASIWSQDLQTASNLADQIQTGTCFINRCDYLDPALAWTGVKQTGLGCSLSKLGYHQLTRVQSFSINEVSE